MSVYRSVYRLVLPSELKRQLCDSLPRQDGAWAPVIHVSPRDRAERKCPAYESDHYEIQAFYMTDDSDSLDTLERALRELSGVYMTTQVRGQEGRNEVTNPDFPARLGVSRRGFHQLRPQVIALMGDRRGTLEDPGRTLI